MSEEKRAEDRCARPGCGWRRIIHSSSPVDVEERHHWQVRLQESWGAGAREACPAFVEPTRSSPSQPPVEVCRYCNGEGTQVVDSEGHREPCICDGGFAPPDPSEPTNDSLIESKYQPSEPAPHPDWVAVHGPDAVPCEACDGGGTGEPGVGMADPCDVCGGTGEAPPSAEVTEEPDTLDNLGAGAGGPGFESRSADKAGSSTESMPTLAPSSSPASEVAVEAEGQEAERPSMATGWARYDGAKVEWSDDRSPKPEGIGWFRTTWVTRKLGEDLAKARSELARSEAQRKQVEESLKRIRTWCPNQPTKHPADNVFTRIIYECRSALSSDSTKEEAQ